MDMKERLLHLLRSLGMDAAAVVFFLLLSYVYFMTPLSQDMVLAGHDSDAAVSQGREQSDYREANDGETTRWTNAMFSGMPTYQIAPSYGATQFLARVSDIYGLGTHGVLLYVFAYLLGFYLMMRAFNFKVWMAALGAVVWAFSSYFFIIIAAGHIWKVMTLAYIPPTIGGLILCYRGRYLWGAAVTALFTAFQVLSNHVQMSYYFFFVMACIVAALGLGTVVRRKEKATMAEKAAQPDGLSLTERLTLGLTPARWLKATGVIVIAGLLGVAANLPNLYHTYDYAKYTMRGGSELTAAKQAAPQTDTEAVADNAAGSGEEQAGKGGLDYNYITQWSYGISETWTFLIPDFKGGGTGPAITAENYTDDDIQRLLPYVQAAGEVGIPQSQIPGINTYWGNQPFTVGPVYVGALVVFLFILGLFVVRGPLKWALAAATLISRFFAWGHNVPGVTHFLIDHLPMYNKFRTVSSALVVAEFTMPLLAMLALAEVLRRRRQLLSDLDGKIGVITAGVLTVGVCLFLWIAPSLAGSCLSDNESQMMALLTGHGVFTPDMAADYTSAIDAVRHGVLSASAGRSLLVLVVGLGIIAVAMFRPRVPKAAVCGGVLLVALVDMWGVNKQYLNDDTFQDPVVRSEQFGRKSHADELILADTAYYRVLDMSVNTFNDNTASYWHHNIGGYHAAKLQRYQDLIERHLSREMPHITDSLYTMAGDERLWQADSAATPVLNMLNMKYTIVVGNNGQRAVAVNPFANGPAWFVRHLTFVGGADAEMAGLSGLDTKQAAVADERFRDVLDGTALGEGSVAFVKYAPNELHYRTESRQGGVMVLSEIYYPGWTATIDGEEVPLGRVNYVLRALRVPAGSHEVVLTFRPTSVSTTNAIGFGAIAVILLLFFGSLAYAAVKYLKGKDHAA